MKKIKVAQIGTSQYSHGNGIWNSILKQSELFEVVGYAFPENEKEKFPLQAQEFAGYREMTVEEILNDPDIEAVAVETEEIYLTKYALMVAKAGKHLHMEKPGGRELADFEDLVRELKTRNLVFSLGYMYRFNPKVQEALAKVEKGDLGKIFSVEAHMNCKHATDVRRWLEVFPGGMMFFLGCHLVDLIYRIQGLPLEVIPLNSSTGMDGVNTSDYGMAVFRYPNGISFAKTCDCELGGFVRRQLVICGEKGTIELQPMEYCVEDKQYSVMKETYTTAWQTTGEVTQSENFDRYDAMMENFALIVRGLKENPYTYDYELNLYKLVLQACGEEVK